METGKCREKWEHTALVISAMAAFAMSPQKIDPKKLNPYYVEPPKTREQEQEESKAAFALLEAGLRELC